MNVSGLILVEIPIIAFTLWKNNVYDLWIHNKCLLRLWILYCSHYKRYSLFRLLIFKRPSFWIFRVFSLMVESLQLTIFLIYLQRTQKKKEEIHTYTQKLWGAFCCFYNSCEFYFPGSVDDILLFTFYISWKTYPSLLRPYSYRKHDLKTESSLQNAN